VAVVKPDGLPRRLAPLLSPSARCPSPSWPRRLGGGEGGPRRVAPVAGAVRGARVGAAGDRLPRGRDPGPAAGLAPRPRPRGPLRLLPPRDLRPREE
jgi:hypothetical protein